MCLQVLIYSLVISRFDYSSSLYVILPRYLVRKPKPVIEVSDRIIYSLPASINTTSYLTELHWLPVKARNEFKICLGF